MSQDQNKSLVKRYLSECFNEGKIATVDEIITSNFIRHDPSLPGGKVDRNGLKQFIRSVHTGVPDFHQEDARVVTEGDYVVTHWRGTGHHTGEFLGIPASGNFGEVDGITINRIENGKIAEEWTVWDALGFLKLAGVAPTMANA